MSLFEIDERLITWIPIVKLHDSNRSFTTKRNSFIESEKAYDVNQISNEAKIKCRANIKSVSREIWVENEHDLKIILKVLINNLG